jgi:hypothetical protein
MEGGSGEKTEDVGAPVATMGSGGILAGAWRLSLLGIGVLSGTMGVEAAWGARQAPGPAKIPPTPICRYGWGESSLSSAYLLDAPIIRCGVTLAKIFQSKGMQMRPIPPP